MNACFHFHLLINCEYLLARLDAGELSQFSKATHEYTRNTIKQTLQLYSNLQIVYICIARVLSLSLSRSLAINQSHGQPTHIEHNSSVSHVIVYAYILIDNA